MGNGANVFFFGGGGGGIANSALVIIFSECFLLPERAFLPRLGAPAVAPLACAAARSTRISSLIEAPVGGAWGGQTRVNEPQTIYYGVEVPAARPLTGGRVARGGGSLERSPFDQPSLGALIIKHERKNLCKAVADKIRLQNSFAAGSEKAGMIKIVVGGKATVRKIG